MNTGRSRRKSGAASAGDDPCGSEAALTDSSSTTSPTRRRTRDGSSPRTSSMNNSDFAKNELASRILGQLNDLRNIACRQLHAGGEEIVELERLVGGMAKSADGKSLSQAQSLMSLFTSPKIISKPESGNAGNNSTTATAQHSPRISCDTTKLLPIEVKVEDVVPDSPSVTYSEQQPSTSSAMTVSQSGISLSGIASQATPTPRSSVAIGAESNVERAAKQEAQVLARVAELRRQGLWTASRLPMIEMPARNKTHWDYLLEEMRWMAADFRQERTFKRHAAKKFATQIARLQRDKEQEEERAQQRAIREAKRVCALIAKMVRDFWQNVDKVVDYRAQEIIESMKRKALDQQLELMVGQADKLSELVQEGLTEKVSKAPSVADENENGDDKDADFAAGFESESDDETTIAKAEATIDTNVEEEMRDLEREKNLELDDLLASLPPGYLASMGMSSRPGPSKVHDEGGSEEHDDSDESENEDFDETTTDADSEGDEEEADGGDEDGEKDTSKGDEGVPSESGEPPTKKKKPIGQVVEEEATTISPTQCDSAMRSASSASIKESELSSSMPPSEEASKDVPEGGINFGRLNSECSEDRQKELANIAEEALKFQPKGFTLETTQVKTDVPSLIRGTLREYQLVGLDWLVTLYDKGLNGILADEMGLGKTIQTIALLAHLACKEAIWGPHLIVVPTSVILNWEMELKKWCPAFKILTYFGSQKERAEKRRGWSKPNMFHVCVTSYKIVTQDIRAFKHKAWQYFILDEAQNIKNFKSQRWQTLLNIRARRRLLLTGTPLQNSLMELWSLMHFLMPAIFASHNDFKDWFSNPLTGMMEGNIEWNAPLVQRLHKVLRPFILRRLKSEVEKQLPEKTEHVVKCPLSKRQRYLYDDFMSLRSTRENLRSGNMMSVLNIVMQLRKCCNHPNLFEPRPVVSPFAMQPLSVTVPAMLLDLCKSANDNDDIPSIPECLRLSHLMRGSHFAWNEIRRLSARRTLIEELNSQQQDSGGSPIPKVDGFKFVRPPPPPAETKQQPEVQSQQTVSTTAAVSMPTGNLPQTGEYYVCVDNGTARVYQLVTTSSGERTIQECDPSTVAGGAAASAQVVSAVEVPTALQPIRVVTPPLISVVAQPIASASTSSSTSNPTTLSHRDIEIKTEIKSEETIADTTQMVVDTSTEQQQQQHSHQQITTTLQSNKPTDRRAVFRTKTVLNKTVIRSGHALKQDLQSVNNGCTSVGTTIPYQLLMCGSSESPSRNRCVAEVHPLTAEGVPLQTVTPIITNGDVRHLSTTSTKPIGTAPSSPPQKRRRINVPKIERQPYAELILPETRQLQKDRKEECAQRIVDWCVRHSEWANVRRAPLVSDELLSIVINETKRKRRPKARNAIAYPGKGKVTSIELNAFECGDELGWIRDRLRLLLEDMVERFTVYVHGAVANAPTLQPTSSGRYAYRKQLDEDVNNACRRLFESSNDPLVFQCRTMQMLQFPELRLIEYDCGKLQVLSALLRDLFIYKHRCLIFTQMSRMLDVLQAFLSFHGYQYFRLDGTTGIEQRQAMMERFNSDPKIFCFILSTRSGGIGVNLTGADTVIFYDSDWNPTMDAQAQDRCHRIGQTRNVTIYRLISERTIEENILKKAMQKRRLGELAIDEAGFTPEFFKGDNLRELFQGEAAVADVVAPVSVNDPAELEKAMARLEDVQDVAAADRANAEAKAELAEFDENVQPKDDNINNSNALDRADSKYFELLNQLKPIERYAINFLEAEYKPDFEEEVKEAEAMIASKKDEWLKAHETVLESGDGDELNDDDDDEYDVTYANGFGIPGSVDEVRSKRGNKSAAIHTSSSANNISSATSKVSPPQPRKQRLIPSRFSSRISAAVALSSKSNTTVSPSNAKTSSNTTTTSRALRLTRRLSSDSNPKTSQTSKRVLPSTANTTNLSVNNSSNDKNMSKRKMITNRTSSTAAANKRNVKSMGIGGTKSKNTKQQRSTKSRSANEKLHKGTTTEMPTVDSKSTEQKLVKRKNRSEISIRNEGNVFVVESDDEHFSLPSSSNESEPQASSSSRKSRGKSTHVMTTVSEQHPLLSSSPSPLSTPTYPSYARSDRQMNTSDDTRASTSASQTFSCVLVPLSPTSVLSSSSTTTNPRAMVGRSMTTSSAAAASGGRNQISGTARGISMQPSTSQKSFLTEDIRQRYITTTNPSTAGINNRQRVITSGRSTPSTSYRVVTTSQSAGGVRSQHISSAVAAGSTAPVQRRLVVVSRSSSSQPVSVINAQQASTSYRSSPNVRVVPTASGSSSSYRVVSTTHSCTSPSLFYEKQQPSYFVTTATSGTSSDAVISDGRRARLSSTSSTGSSYTKPSLGDYERPRLFFRKRVSVPQQTRVQQHSSEVDDDRASSSGNAVHIRATGSDGNDVDDNANTETGAS